MFLLYYFAIFIALKQNVIAQDIQTLDEINAELLKKKEELEPFNDKDIKIDLESLGLDDVNKKEKKQEKEEELKLPDLSDIIIESDESKKNKEKQPENKESSSIISAIKNVISPENKDDKAKEIKKEAKPVAKKAEVKLEAKMEAKMEENKLEVQENLEPKKIDGKTENSDIVKSLTNNIILQKNNDDKIKEEPVKKPLENTKLQKLREQYLIKIDDKKNNSLDKKESEIILPKRKNVNPFISDELPAVPILNTYRTFDNQHIPIFLTYEERIKNLFDAISYDNVAFFNSAYENIKNPNIRNSLGDTILTYAILLGRYDIMISVINKGANVDLPNKLGYSPLDIAIELLDFKAFEILVNNNANIFQLDLFGRSYLTHASRLGFLSAVGVLVQKGLDVNLIDKEGFTPLTVAYRNNRELVARFLLKNGAKNQNNIDFNRSSQSIIKELENRWK